MGGSTADGTTSSACASSQTSSHAHDRRRMSAYPTDALASRDAGGPCAAGSRQCGGRCSGASRVHHAFRARRRGSACTAESRRFPVAADVATRGDDGGHECLLTPSKTERHTPNGQVRTFAWALQARGRDLCLTPTVGRPGLGPRRGRRARKARANAATAAAKPRVPPLTGRLGQLGVAPSTRARLSVE
jgi:hypothetical protein